MDINSLKIAADDICNYLSKGELIVYKSKGYKKPDNLKIYKNTVVSLSKESSPHIRCRIFWNDKRITLNIRVDSLKEFRGFYVNRRKHKISKVIRDYLTGRKLIEGERQLIPDSHFKNLLFIKSHSTLEDVALQIGIYSYQNGLIVNKMNLYSLFFVIVNEIYPVYSIQDEKGVTTLQNKVEISDTDLYDNVIKNFQLPNDYKSIRNIIKQLFRYSEFQPFKVQDRYEVPPDTIYSWLKRKQLQIPKNANGTYDYDEVEVDRLNELKIKRRAMLEAKALNNYLAPILAKKRNTSLESAKRTIRRWKKKGLKPKKLKEKIEQL